MTANILHKSITGHLSQRYTAFTINELLLVTGHYKFFLYPTYNVFETKVFVTICIIMFYNLDWRCDTDITVTITSSECSRPLEGVYIRSNSWYSRVISSSDGVYTLRVCSLPVSIYMWKRGYRYRRMVARHTEETVTLECIGRKLVYYNSI